MEAMALGGGFGTFTGGLTLQPPARVELVDVRKRTWTLIYSEGGWWTEEEIRHELKVGKRIHSALSEMVRDGFLERKRARNIDDELVVSYGVTGKCKMPRGLVVGEVEKLLLLAVKAAP
jgi:hypothetical protein